MDLDALAMRLQNLASRLEPMLPFLEHLHGKHQAQQIEPGSIPASHEETLERIAPLLPHLEKLVDTVTSEHPPHDEVASPPVEKSAPTPKPAAKKAPVKKPVPRKKRHA